MRSAVFGDAHVVALTGGATPAAVRIGIPGGAVDTIDLAAPFDRAFLSPSGRHVVAIHDARFARTTPVVAVNNNEIAVVDLERDLTAGVVTGILTDSDFRVPTTVARFGNDLYVVNARFGVPPDPTTEYEVVQVR